MNIWFVRSNGNTGHNNPADDNYVPGEPPIFPNREFNYRLKCLDQGFARYGHPNTGDLREKIQQGWRHQVILFKVLKKDTKLICVSFHRLRLAI